MSTDAIALLEVIWIIVNATTLLLTVGALADARADQSAVKLLNGSARELAARGIVRREWFRLAVQALLLSFVLPVLFPAQIARGSFTGILLAIALVLLASTLLDARDRRRMIVLIAGETLAWRGRPHTEVATPTPLEMSGPEE